MKLKKTIVLTLAALMVMTVPLTVAVNAQNQSQTAQNNQQNQQQTQQPKVAAVVNEEEITNSELDQYAGTQQLVMSLYRSNQDFARVLLQTEEGQNLIKEYRKQKLDQLITQKLLEQEAEERGIKVSQEEKDEAFQQHLEQIKSQNNLSDEQVKQALQKQGMSLEQYKQRFLSGSTTGMKTDKLREKVVGDINISESNIKDYYDSHPAEFEHKSQVKVRHIVVDEKAKAQEIKSKLEEGGDFAELAKENSTGPSADKGGQLGFVGKDARISSAFKDAAFQLDVGQVSDPVKTEQGFHIIKVEDKKEPGVTPLSEVKSQIKNQLKQKKQKEEWNQFVKQLREEAEIEKKLK